MARLPGLPEPEGRSELPPPEGRGSFADSEVGGFLRNLGKDNVIIEAVKEAPGTFASFFTEALPQLGGDIYQSVINPVKSVQEGTTERALRGIGGLAASTAGGALGAIGGPAGIGIGATTGGALFEKAADTVTNLIKGDEVSFSFTPEGKRELTKSAIQNVMFAGLPKVLTKGAQVAKKGAGKVSGYLKGQQEALTKEGLGFTSAVEKQAFKRGESAIGEEGQRLTLEERAAGLQDDFQTKLSRDYALLKEQGVLENLPEDPLKIKKIFDQKEAQVDLEINRLRDSASEALSAEYSKLSPIQQAKFPLKFSPDFSPIKNFISEKIRPSQPKLANSLTNNLNSVIEQWKKSSRSFDALSKFKRSASEGKKLFQKAKGAEPASEIVQEMLYNVYRNAETSAFDFIMQKTDPSKVGALARANQVSSAYKTFKKVLGEATPRLQRKSGVFDKLFGAGTILPSLGAGYVSPPLGGLLFAAKAAKSIPEYAPLSTARVAGTLAGGIDDVSALFRPVPDSFGIPAAALGVLSTDASPGIPTNFLEEFPNEKKNEISPISDNLLDAVRQVESGGGKYLESKAGALGPYQFMPATAKAYGLKDPYNEEESRRAAKALLSDELQALGSIELALAAYNAGRPAVLRAIEKAGSKDFSKVAKYLPEETKNYVPKIKQYLV